jgi:hypothetical protein
MIDNEKEVSNPFQSLDIVEVTKNDEMVEERTIGVMKDFVEPESALAFGLPKWTLEPPQVVIRKKQKL